jgi:hypothetical protein
MAIEVQEYSPEDGEMIYTITAEVSGEQFSLAVRPKGKVNVRVFVWRGDRQDPEDQKILKSDPVDFSYEKSREKVYEQFAKVFGVKPWFRDALQSFGVKRQSHPRCFLI